MLLCFMGVAMRMSLFLYVLCTCLVIGLSDYACLCLFMCVFVCLTIFMFVCVSACKSMCFRLFLCVAFRVFLS